MIRAVATREYLLEIISIAKLYILNLASKTTALSKFPFISKMDVFLTVLVWFRVDILLLNRRFLVFVDPLRLTFTPQPAFGSQIKVLGPKPHFALRHTPDQKPVGLEKVGFPSLPISFA